MLGGGVEPSAVEQHQADRVLCGRLILLGQRRSGQGGGRRMLRGIGNRYGFGFPRPGRWGCGRLAELLGNESLEVGPSAERFQGNPPRPISTICCRRRLAACRRASIARSASRDCSARSASVGLSDSLPPCHFELATRQ